MLKVSKKDYLWSYFSFILKYGSTLILTPFSVLLLPNEELGLWYSFASVTAIVALLDFGFSKTITRNITFAWSGARELVKEGMSRETGALNIPNYRLFTLVFVTSRYISLLLAIAALIIMLTAGTGYIDYVMRDYDKSYNIVWVVYAIAIFLNLFYGYWVSTLNGIGAIEKAQKATTISILVQLPVSIVGLYLGYGLMAMSLGYFSGSLVMRLVARKFLYESIDKNHFIQESKSIQKSDVFNTFKIIWYNAKKLGIGMLALTVIYQSSTFICSIVIGVEKTAAYGLANQIVAIIITVANVFYSTNIPNFSHLRLLGKKEELKRVYSLSIFVYWTVCMGALILLITVGMKILLIFKPDLDVSINLILILGIVHFIEGHFIMNCNIITTSNRIPYTKSYIYTSISMVLLSVLFTVILNWEVYGLILAKAIAELYVAWKWPRYIMEELGVSFKNIFRIGIREVQNQIKKIKRQGSYMK
ncbi:O-unit flippase-like protein [Priestia megaterium]|uniref:O-unit flippase-like protein n=1 Tax=Priestia megaterium TaxID=1404 RepID=UPI0022B8DBB5|nr:O-unit flippase-like protein [Priestia megaterium]MCZ8493358.1 hypothetical protein [Priestia megaterium]